LLPTFSTEIMPINNHFSVDGTGLCRHFDSNTSLAHALLVHTTSLQSPFHCNRRSNHRAPDRSHPPPAPPSHRQRVRAASSPPPPLSLALTLFDGYSYPSLPPRSYTTIAMKFPFTVVIDTGSQRTPPIEFKNIEFSSEMNKLTVCITSTRTDGCAIIMCGHCDCMQ
jgi:hypothetical protein